MIRTAAALAILFVTVAFASAANPGLIHLTSFPTISVADGHSTVSIDADIRDTNGRPIADGTRVVFSTDLGSFREPLGVTHGGVAHTVLVAGSLPGIAKITATALGYQATATMAYQFVGDRSLLSNAKEYIEVVGEKDVRYSFEDKIIVASGPKRKAFLRYREIEIHADDLQLNVPSYEVKAKNALLRIGKLEVPCGELYFKLNERYGYGTTTYKHPSMAVQPEGRTFKFVPGPEEDSYGIAEITPAGVKAPTVTVPSNTYAFDDLGNTATEIAGKKVTAFPGKQIQFEGAEVFLDRAKVLKMPLYQLDLTGDNRLFSDSIINVNNNQLAVNYPYYLTLKPGLTSLLRLRTGQTDGRSLETNRGVFLDYEYNWNRGDDMQGGVALQGLGRSDWGLRGTQYWRGGDGSSVSALVEVPSHRSIYGTLNANKPFKGYELSTNASMGRTFRGDPFTTSQYNLTLEKDPVRLGKIPFNLYLGATAFSTSNHSSKSYIDPSDPQYLIIEVREASQSAYGLRLRGQSQQLNFGRATSLSSSFSISKLSGHNVLNGLTYLASVQLSQGLGRDAHFTLGYDYTQDGYNSVLLGRHQLSLQANYNTGHVMFDFFGIKAMDQDRFAYQLDTSYRLNRTWRLGYSLTAQRYLGDSYTDYSYVLGYRLGYKEFGLTWSQKTHRIGFQLLGTTFN